MRKDDHLILILGVITLMPVVHAQTGLGPSGTENHCFTMCTSFSPDLPSGCQRPPPTGLANRDNPLWMYKGWTSLDMTSMMTKILIRDVLGYKNVSLTMNNANRNRGYTSYSNKARVTQASQPRHVAL